MLRFIKERIKVNNKHEKMCGFPINNEKCPFLIHYWPKCLLFDKELKGAIYQRRRCPECISLLKNI